MRRDLTRRVVMLALALIILGAPPQPREVLAFGLDTHGQPGWVRVWDRTHTMSVAVPREWKTTAGTQGSSIVAIAPDGMPQVSVVAERVGASMTSDQYAAEKTKALQAALPSAHVLPISTTEHLEGVDVHAEGFAWSVGGKVYAIIQEAMVIDGVGIVATETEDYAAFDAQLALAVTVAGTFKMTGKSAGQTSAALVPLGRRDLFAAPPGVAGLSSSVGGSESVPLPPMPVPGTPGPAVAPAPLPALPGATGDKSVPVLPVELRGIVLGATPQAVLVSDGDYQIVTVGQGTPWGTVRSITATTVTLEGGSGSRTLTFETHSAAPKETKTGGTH